MCYLYVTKVIQGGWIDYKCRFIHCSNWFWTLSLRLSIFSLLQHTAHTATWRRHTLKHPGDELNSLSLMTIGRCETLMCTSFGRSSSRPFFTISFTFKHSTLNCWLFSNSGNLVLCFGCKHFSFLPYGNYITSSFQWSSKTGYRQLTQKNAP